MPFVLAGAVSSEAVLAIRHEDVIVEQPHTEVEVTTPHVATVSIPLASGGGGQITDFMLNQIS